jgi:membrane protein DedA with SNARE-associated domain
VSYDGAAGGLTMLIVGRIAGTRSPGADVFFARYGVATVFFGRWIPLVRIVAALSAGAARMPWRRFALANAAGGLCWAASVATLAWALGPSGATLLAVAGLALGGVTLAGGWLRRRRPAGTHRRGPGAR